MFVARCLLLNLCMLWILSVLALADQPPKTKLSTPTELIVATPFDRDTPLIRKKPIAGWTAAIGQWQVKDGALHGDEVPEDNHASSCTYATEVSDLVITAEFRLGTAQQIAFGCRDNVEPNNHLARTFISKDAFWITHMSGIGKTTKSQKIAELKQPLDPEAWHRITIEIIGDKYRAQIDEHVVQAQHARFADKKGLIVLVTKGQGAQFKNLAIWKAKPSAY